MTISLEEEAEVLAIINVALSAKKKQQDEERWKTVAKEARKEWEATAIAPDDHPYLMSKQIKAHGIHVGVGDRLIVPIYIEDNKEVEISNLQYILKNGKPIFLEDSRAKGGIWGLDARGSKDYNPRYIFVCEGFVTAASVQEATGCTTLIAFYVKNLVNVAEFVKKHYPDRDVCFVANNTKKNVGIEEAVKAALKIKAKVWKTPVGYRDANAFACAGGNLRESLFAVFKERE